MWKGRTWTLLYYANLFVKEMPVLVLAILCKRGVPLGPMPNEDIDVSNLDALEKYRSYRRYFKVAEKERKKLQWWSTYKKHVTPKQGNQLEGHMWLCSLLLKRKWLPSPWIPPLPERDRESHSHACIGSLPLSLFSARIKRSLHLLSNHHLKDFLLKLNHPKIPQTLMSDYFMMKVVPVLENASSTCSKYPNTKNFLNPLPHFFLSKLQYDKRFQVDIST